VSVLADWDTVSVNFDVPEPGAAMGFGLKLPVTPEGRPVALSEIAKLNPPETAVVTVAYPLCPRLRDPEVGETEMVKFGVTEPTLSTVPAAGV
jgi:hypothetical protein